MFAIQYFILSSLPSSPPQSNLKTETTEIHIKIFDNIFYESFEVADFRRKTKSGASNKQRFLPYCFILQLNDSFFLIFLPGRHLRDLPDCANKAGDDQEGNDNFEEEEAAHQERVEHGHQRPDALRVETVDTCLEKTNNLITLRLSLNGECNF